MNASDPTAGLDDDMLEWIRSVTGARQIAAERRSAGASRAGYAMDATADDGSRQALWLRTDTGAGPQSNGHYTLRREAAVYRALRAHGVKVAEVVAVHPTREAFLMQRLEGRNWFSEIEDLEQQRRLATTFMTELASVHRIDVREVDLPELGPVSTIRDHVLDEISIWDEQHRAQPPGDPLIELALAWLRRNVPPDGDWPVVLVQGDTGPGNFMYRGDELVAITDWEMAHLGDLHDDLAWIYVRDAQERFTDLPERVRDYEAAYGRRIDAERLRYFLVLAQTRCAIGTRNGLLARDARGEIASHLIYSTLHARLLAEALAAAIDVEPAPAAATPWPEQPTQSTWMYDVALADLRENVLPALSDSFAIRRAKGMARLLKYLRENERLGPTVDRLEADDLAATLGRAVTDLASARAELCRAIAEGAAPDDAVMAYCLAQVSRRTHVLRPSMGALADRHHAPFPDHDREA